MALLTKRKLNVKKFFRDNYAGWLCNLPLFVGMAIFTAVPVATSLWYAFNKFDGFVMEFYGFRNFIGAFTVDKKENITAVLNTLYYTVVSIPLTLVLSYMLAVLVNKSLPGIKVFRVFYYMPCVIPAVVSGLLWKDMYDPTFGFCNGILQKMGLPTSRFFSDPKSAMPSVFFMNLWGLGGGMILWLAAFRNIPRQLYEAAELDGAGTVKKFFHITIPMSTPMIFYNVITMIIGSLQTNTMTFAKNYGRGEENSLYMIGSKLYWEAFQRSRLGYASALSWMLLIVIGALTALMFKTSKWVYYGEEG